MLATVLLPGLILGILIHVWHLPWAQRAFAKNRTWQRFLDQVYRSGGFVEDEEVEDRVTRVGRRIALAAGHSVDAIEFCVVKDQYIYACVCPMTNIVAISKGMYEDFRNDDELASVLAHEVAHICMYNKTGQIPVTLTASKVWESKADLLAVELVTRAGFDARRFAQCFWRYMGYQFLMGGDISNDKASTHPSYLKRIIDINRSIESQICYE